MNELRLKGKDFMVHGMTFDELNEHQENDHDQKVQEEKERKKEEKKKLMVQESIFGVVSKTPIRGGNRTLRQVKRLNQDSKMVSTNKSVFFNVTKVIRLPFRKNLYRFFFFENPDLDKKMMNEKK